MIRSLNANRACTPLLVKAFVDALKLPRLLLHRIGTLLLTTTYCSISYWDPISTVKYDKMYKLYYQLTPAAFAEYIFICLSFKYNITFPYPTHHIM